uniref:Uncharacterized protein n=1 Tax=Cacopsylla melanoneura TaxID=428564 RepID=A0A8D8Q578_9HEMI
MATQVESDKKMTLGSEGPNVSYAGALLNKAGDINTENVPPPVKKEVKEVKESPKVTPSVNKTACTTVKPKISSPKVQNKENDKVVSIEPPTSKVNSMEDTKPQQRAQDVKVAENKGEPIADDDDHDFCKVTTRKSKEKRNVDKFSIVPESRHPRMKKIKRSDSITNDWRSKPAPPAPVCDENAENKEVDPDLKFVEAPLPKVNPWTAKKPAASVISQKVTESEIKEKRVLQPQQQESATSVSENGLPSSKPAVAAPAPQEPPVVGSAPAPVVVNGQSTPRQTNSAPPVRKPPQQQTNNSAPPAGAGTRTSYSKKAGDFTRSEDWPTLGTVLEKKASPSTPPPPLTPPTPLNVINQNGGREDPPTPSPSTPPLSTEGSGNSSNAENTQDNKQLSSKKKVSKKKWVPVPLDIEPISKTRARQRARSPRYSNNNNTNRDSRDNQSYRSRDNSRHSIGKLGLA